MLRPVTGDSVSPMMPLGGLIGAVLPVRSRGAGIDQSGFAAPAAVFWSLDCFGSAGFLVFSRSVVGFVSAGGVADVGAGPWAPSLARVSFCLSRPSRTR